MFNRKVTLIGLLVSAACCTVSGRLFAQVDMAAKAKAAFALSVRPDPLIAHANKPIYLTLILRNVSKHAAYIRLWVWPTPFGPHTNLHCLMLRCRNQGTGGPVRLTPAI